MWFCSYTEVISRGTVHSGFYYRCCALRLSMVVPTESTRRFAPRSVILRMHVETRGTLFVAFQSLRQP